VLLEAGRAAYRHALRLYPERFYRAYAAELEADFDDAAEEGMAAAGQWGVWSAWAVAWRDLPLSLAREWLRTPWLPALILAAAVATSTLAFSLVRVTGAVARYRAIVAPRVPAPADSPQLFMLMLLMVLVPIVSIIVIGGVVAFTARYTGRLNRRV
jgi:hypothetical protein